MTEELWDDDDVGVHLEASLRIPKRLASFSSGLETYGKRHSVLNLPFVSLITAAWTHEDLIERFDIDQQNDVRTQDVA